MTRETPGRRVEMVVDGLAEALLEASRDAIFVSDAAARVVAVNAAACTLTGHDRHELLAMSIPDLHDEVDLRADRGYHAKILAGEDAVTRATLRRRDGTTVETELSSRALTIGGAVFVHTTARDVTEEVRREEELLVSEASFRDLVENLNDVVYRVDLDGIIRYLSPPVTAVLGYAADDLVGTAYGGLVHPDDLERIRQAFTGVLAGRIEPREYRMRHRDGSWRWVRTSSRPVREGGEVVGLQGVLADVTGRVRAEAALQESERRYQTLVERATVGIFATRSTGEVLLVNPAMARILGFPSPEAVVAHYADVGRELYADATRREEFLRRLSTDGEVAGFEYEARRVDGSTVWLTMNARTADRAPDGSFVIEGFTADVTHRVRADALLRESEARHRTLFESMRQGAFYQRADGSVEDVNPAALEMFGLTREEFLGRTSEHTEWDAILPDGSPLPPERHPSMVALRTGEPVRDAVAGVRNALTGERIWMVVNATPEPLDAETTPSRVAVTLHDITERLRAEEERVRLVDEVRRLAARLAAVQEAERKLLASELHDRVGQSLTSLGLTLDLIRSTLPDEPRRLVAGRLDAAVALVGQTMNRVRDVMGELRPPMLDEYGLLPTLVWWAGVFEERTGVTVDVSGPAPDPRLGVDIELAVFRIVQEALSNVARHSGVRTAEVRLGPSRGGVSVAVVDQGRGFDPSGATGNGPQERWGIAIMRERALAAGASLQVDAAPGCGTRVTVTVPG